MHGLQWRVPLFIELDELHRSCIIDPNLSNEKRSACPKKRRNGQGDGRVKGGSRGRSINSRMRPNCHSDPRSSERRKPNDRRASSMLGQAGRRPCTYRDAQPIVFNSIPIYVAVHPGQRRRRTIGEWDRWEYQCNPIEERVTDGSHLVGLHGSERSPTLCSPYTTFW